MSPELGVKLLCGVLVLYFLVITAELVCKIIGIIYSELAIKHPQPIWCNYPHATEGIMGCWSLVGHMIKNKESCKPCELCDSF